MIEKNQIIENLKSWIDYISAPQEELDNWSICPFAKQVKNLEFIILNDLNVQSIEENLDKILHSEVTIFTNGTLTPTFNDLDFLCKFLNKKYQDLIFLPDHPHTPHFISSLETNNKDYSLILVQSKKKLLNSRKTLEKSKYYTFWTKEYKKEIFSYGSGL